MHEEDVPKKRQRRFNGDMGVDSQGQNVEYEHGYLRHKIKEERGVLKRRQQRSPAFNPQIVEDCGVEILYLLELEALPASITGSLPIELWWRNAGNPAAPLQPLAPSGETTLPSSEDAALLKALMPHRETTPGCRGNTLRIHRVSLATAHPAGENACQDSIARSPCGVAIQTLGRIRPPDINTSDRNSSRRLSHSSTRRRSSATRRQPKNASRGFTR